MKNKRRMRQGAVWMQVLDGGRLERHRKRRGLTQKELAMLAKCSQNTIHLLEAGKMKTLSEDLANRIAVRLGEPVEEYFAPRTSIAVPHVGTGGRVA